MLTNRPTETPHDDKANSTFWRREDSSSSHWTSEIKYLNSVGAKISDTEWLQSDGNKQGMAQMKVVYDLEFNPKLFIPIQNLFFNIFIKWFFFQIQTNTKRKKDERAYEKKWKKTIFDWNIDKRKVIQNDLFSYFTKRKWMIQNEFNFASLHEILRFFPTNVNRRLGWYGKLELNWR